MLSYPLPYCILFFFGEQEMEVFALTIFGMIFYKTLLASIRFVDIPINKNGLVFSQSQYLCIFSMLSCAIRVLQLLSCCPRLFFDFLQTRHIGSFEIGSFVSQEFVLFHSQCFHPLKDSRTIPANDLGSLVYGQVFWFFSLLIHNVFSDRASLSHICQLSIKIIADVLDFVKHLAKSIVKVLKSVVHVWYTSK